MQTRMQEEEEFVDGRLDFGWMTSLVMAARILLASFLILTSIVAFLVFRPRVSTIDSFMEEWEQKEEKDFGVREKKILAIGRLMADPFLVFMRTIACPLLD